MHPVFMSSYIGFKPKTKKEERKNSSSSSSDASSNAVFTDESSDSSVAKVELAVTCSRIYWMGRRMGRRWASCWTITRP